MARTQVDIMACHMEILKQLEALIMNSLNTLRMIAISILH